MFIKKDDVKNSLMVYSERNCQVLLALSLISFSLQPSISQRHIKPVHLHLEWTQNNAFSISEMKNHLHSLEPMNHFQIFGSLSKCVRIQKDKGHIQAQDNQMTLKNNHHLDSTGCCSSFTLPNGVSLGPNSRSS